MKAIRIINKAIKRWESEMSFCESMEKMVKTKQMRNEYARGSVYCYDFLVKLREIKESLKEDKP